MICMGRCEMAGMIFQTRSEPDRTMYPLNR